MLLFTGLSHADLDPLHLMYLMVVVVAAVDAVYNVSFTQSDAVWRWAYRCEEQEITRGGFWDQLPADSACPHDLPQTRQAKINVFHNVFPTCVPSTSQGPQQAYVARWKIVSTLVINDDPKLALRGDV